MKKGLIFSEILNLDEASLFLRVGKKTLSNLAKKGGIPARKIGREWRFVKSVLLNWLSCGGIKEAHFTRRSSHRGREAGQFIEEYPKPLYLDNQNLTSAPKKEKRGAR